MNIVITAGGTSEYIDTVRKITNSGTGRLGSIITSRLLLRDDIVKIFYIHSKGAIKPDISDSNIEVEFIEIKGTLDLKAAVENVLTNNKIDYFIHSMAVSDYIVDYVTTADMLSDYVKDNGVSAESIINNENVLDNTTKISSYEENLIIKLKKAPKVIGIVKKLSPETKLIGFKLLTDVSKEELIDVASKLRDKNDCDYVVANDMKDINATSHRAYILAKDNSIIDAYTKDDIADKLSEIVKKKN